MLHLQIDKTFNITSDFNGRQIWYNSSLMKWNSERMTPIIWEKFIKDRQYWYRLQGDQNAITELLTEKDKSLVKDFHENNV